MANIRVDDLPEDDAPSASDFTIVDALTMRKTSVADLVAAGRPLASQAEAEAGTDPSKAMTPLTTAQAIAALRPSGSTGLQLLLSSTALEALQVLGAGTTGIDVLEAETAADIRALLDLEPGTDVQAWNDTLQDIADGVIAVQPFATEAEAEAGISETVNMSPARTVDTINSFVKFNADVTYNIPTDYATIQEAFDDLSARTFKAGVIVVVNFETGHQPESGLVLEGGDYSHIWIRSTDAVVTLAPTFTSALGAFLWSRNCTLPVWDILLDCDGLVDIGVHLVELCRGTIRPAKGVNNALVENVSVRCSRLTAEQADFDGGGYTGLSVQQASQVRAQGSHANNCGVNGYDVSRGSTANMIEATANNCGFDSLAQTGDANFINQGGLVVRRSFVAATAIDVSGCTQGISTQLCSIIEAENINADDCTIRGIRASSFARVNAANGSFQNIDTASSVGVSAGFGGQIMASGGNFTGTTETFSIFGSSASIDVSTATLGGSTFTGEFNTPSAAGVVWRSDIPNLPKPAGHGTPNEFVLADDTATSFLVPGSGNDRSFTLIVTAGVGNRSGVANFRASNVFAERQSGGTQFAVTTGVLSGTTGTDGNCTVSVHTDGRVYIENRSGGSLRVSATIIGLNNIG